jgi:hypothetical protein
LITLRHWLTCFSLLAAMQQPLVAQASPDRPVVVIPGILGSKICEKASGKVIWGDRWSLGNFQELVDENLENDFAILAIAQQDIKSLAVASSSQLKKTHPVLVAGFPQSSGYKGRIINIWSVDLANFRVALDGRAQPGQSGGAVIDAQGRVVALISENDNKQNPQFHNAVIVSEPIEALNRYLRERGQPQIFLQDASPFGPKFSVHDRSGSAFVKLTGDVGELSGIKQQDNAIGTTAAPISAAGNERSDCIESFDRSSSEASGSAWIQPFELTGLKLRLKATAKGGHF